MVVMVDVDVDDVMTPLGSVRVVVVVVVVGMGDNLIRLVG